MSDEARRQLAADQARLVAALAGRATSPPGFDADRVSLAARTLVAKRGRSLARGWPVFAAELGDSYERLFAQYASASLLPESPSDDGLAFARWLRSTRALPARAVPVWIAAELWQRRCFSVMVRRIGARLVIGVRLPRVGVRVITIGGAIQSLLRRDAAPAPGKMATARRPIVQSGRKRNCMATLCPACGAKNLEGEDECGNCGGDLRAADLPKAASEVEESVMHLPLTTLAMTQIHAVAPDAPLDVAIQTLVRQKVDLVNVVENGKVLGVLSVRDLVTRAGADYASKLKRPVREFMTSRVETLPPDAPITFALNRMDVGGFRHVPVVQGDRAIGIVSSRDVLAYIIKHSRETVATEGVTTSHGVQK